MSKPDLFVIHFKLFIEYLSDFLCSLLGGVNKVYALLIGGLANGLFPDKLELVLFLNDVVDLIA